jgi:ADP-ribosylglycohydrolase
MTKALKSTKNSRGFFWRQIVKKITETELYKKVAGCIFGGAVGDAFGGPIETMHYKFIRQLHEGTVKDLISYNTRPSDFHQAGDSSGAYAWSVEPGTYTDDTRLQILITKAIIERKGRVSADDLADTWMREMDVSKYWHSIANAYHRIAIGRTPIREAGIGNIPDNSSAMCIGPIGIINAGNPRQAALDAYDVASLSHDGYSREAACVIAAAVAEAMNPSTTVNAIIEASTALLPNKETSAVYQSMVKAIELAEKAEDTEKLTELYYHELIVPWIRRADVYHTDDERFSLSVDPLESVPCALGMFYKTDGKYRDCVTACGNFGRDCDTIACMAGYISGAFNGIDGIPQKWVEQSKGANPEPDLEQLCIGLTEALIEERERMRAQVEFIGEMLG